MAEGDTVACSVATDRGHGVDASQVKALKISSTSTGTFRQK